MHAFIIIVLILAILLVIFTLQNSFEITITAFFWEIPEAPLVLVLLVCVFLGYLVSAIYFYPRLWNLKKNYKKLSKTNSKLSQEIIELKQKTSKNKSGPEGIELDVDDDSEEGFFKE